MGGLVQRLACAGLITSGAWVAYLPATGDHPAGSADPPESRSPVSAGTGRDEAERFLTSRGLRREGLSFVLLAEVELRGRISRLASLVEENQDALRRRQLRSVIVGRSRWLRANLQIQ
jgi:hypothetical protein